MATIKALIPGVLLTYAVSEILGSSGVRGGTLYIQHAYLADHSLFWSWPLFVASFGLARALVWMMD